MFLLPPFLLSIFQYSGFLLVILIVELTLAVSLYTYKDHLTGGLRKGLNQSLHNYGPMAVMQSADFDAMQENVRINFLDFFLNNHKNQINTIQYMRTFVYVAGLLWK